MEALANYWLNRLGIDNSKQRECFVTLIGNAFKALDNGDTVSSTELSISSNLNANLAITIEQAIKGHFAPLVISDHLIWLFRSWRAEHELAQLILARLATPAVSSPDSIDRYLTNLRHEQKNAVRHATQHCLSIINGGPGTGKTYTVARLTQLLHEANQEQSIALAAPTGKAAKRMEESLRASLTNEVDHTFLPPAQTLHRLLGIGVDGIPKYNSKRHLPYEIVIVDEASMLSLEMAHALFAAVAPHAKLILLGDADQLAAVDPGAVLHDLSHHPKVKAALTTLKESSRFDSQSGIGQLALELQQDKMHNNDESFLSALSGFSDVIWRSSLDTQTYRTLFRPYEEYVKALQKQHIEPEVLLNIFDQYRILCAGHHGSLGTTQINQAMLKQHQLAQNEAVGSLSFHGMPIMVTANDYRLGIFNGDIGLCLRHAGELTVYFPGLESAIPFTQINPTKWQLAYALTVHKSQGSEYDHVALVLDSTARSATRELLYTGVTRAKKQLSLFASKMTLIKAANNPIKRSTGLAWLIDKELPTD